MNKTSVQSIFTSNLNRLLDKKGISQIELAKAIGVSATTINNYSKGYNMPRMDRLDKIARFLNVTRSELITDPDDNIYDIPGIIPVNKIIKIPILGEISCGSPIFSEENYSGFFVSDPSNINADFILIAKGDSMVEASIYEGDLVFFKRTPDVENGAIAAVYIDGEATLKRIRKADGVLILEPCNKKYSPTIITGDTTDEIRILGEMLGVYSERRS